MKETEVAIQRMTEYILTNLHEDITAKDVAPGGRGWGSFGVRRNRRFV